jgi:hypothetical protein
VKAGIVASALLFVACAHEAPPSRFVAHLRDFQGYEHWTRFDRGFDPVPPTHVRRSVIFVNTLPDDGTDRFAVGTRIVRVEEEGENPKNWELHAMVKRGGGYNAEGATDWEFFELSLDAGRRPSIVWRGEGPADGDGYRAAPGGALLGCNHCHGAARYNDSVLSPVLQLSSPTTRRASL